MKSLSSVPSRFRRSLLLGFLLAFGASVASQAAPVERLRTTATTGIFTLLPRQIVRLHVVDVGPTTALPSKARLELRDDRGTLLGSLRSTTLRPGTPVHLVLRSASLLGSRPFLYVRAIAIVETDPENPESSPIFSVEVHPEVPSSSSGGLSLTTVAKCPMHEGGDTTHPPFEHSCGGGDCDVTRELFLADPAR